MEPPQGRTKLAAPAAMFLALLCATLPQCSATATRGTARPEIPLGLDAYMPIPEDNQLTREKVALGRRLFSDTILSRDGHLACVSCHQPERAFTDGRPVAVGVFGRKGTRNVPTLINRAYGATFFWDGRISSLEVQVLQPIRDPREMDLTPGDAVDRLRDHREYPALFQTAFGREITTDDLARTLASYVRTILSGDAPFDRYMNGERDALSEQALQGLRIFRGKGNCTACHLGPSFTDERFHNTGVAWQDGALLDQGRYMVTGQEDDRGTFKVPTLREIARTAPYMHDGSITTLEDVVDFYDRGGNPNPYLDPHIRPLRLTAVEKLALLAFLGSLSGEVREGVTR